ncbi:MAG: exosome complex RNA-binding protein Rrp4 [Candidatus Hodarchaeota archaeon]
MVLSENNKYRLVIPGELLIEGKYRAGRGVYKRKSGDIYNYYSSLTGLALLRGNVVSVVPLEGGYLPLEGDVVIGIVTTVGVTSWIVDIRGPYPGILSVNNVTDRPFDPIRDDIKRILGLGDVIMARVVAFDRTRDPVLSMRGRGLKKLWNGRLVEISPVKVPRIIGKRGSMISLIKKETKSQIFVGQNGRVLISSPSLEHELLVLKAFTKIVEESHTSGLTDRIQQFLKEEREKEKQKEEEKQQDE